MSSKIIGMSNTVCIVIVTLFCQCYPIIASIFGDTSFFCHIICVLNIHLLYMCIIYNHLYNLFYSKLLSYAKKNNNNSDLKRVTMNGSANRRIVEYSTAHTVLGKHNCNIYFNLR